MREKKLPTASRGRIKRSECESDRCCIIRYAVAERAEILDIENCIIREVRRGAGDSAATCGSGRSELEPKFGDRDALRDASVAGDAGYDGEDVGVGDITRDDYWQ